MRTIGQAFDKFQHLGGRFAVSDPRHNGRSDNRSFGDARDLPARFGRADAETHDDGQIAGRLDTSHFGRHVPGLRGSGTGDAGD